MDNVIRFREKQADAGVAGQAVVFVVMGFVLLAMGAGLAQLGQQPPFAVDDPASLMFMYG